MYIVLQCTCALYMYVHATLYMYMYVLRNCIESANHADHVRSGNRYLDSTSGGYFNIRRWQKMVDVSTRHFVGLQAAHEGCLCTVFRVCFLAE